MTLLIVLSGLLVVTGPSVRSPLSHRAAHAAAHPANLQSVTLYSRALGRATSLYVLLPDSYSSTRRRYPVLYLLNGNLGTYQDWPRTTDVVAFARRLPVIIVMTGDGSYWYANPVSGAGPRWEDYHIDELIPYVDRHFRTIATRDGRAVAGLSTGGYGAFLYAARHPDLFVAAASFSGSLDLLPLQHRATFPNLLATMGDPVAQAWYWDGHDPVDLASNLRGLRLYLTSGNGQPGPFDRPYTPVDHFEEYSHAAMLAMVAALRRARIPATVADYGPGTHTWGYFQRDLHRALRWLLSGPFAHPPAPPAPWSYRTTLNHFAVWGYRGNRSGDTHSWIQLRRVSATGLSAAGTGILTITTGRLYRPGALYTATIGGTRERVRADATGHLSLSVVLNNPRRLRRLSIALLRT